MTMRPFELRGDGPDVVAEGVEFSDGTVVLRWLGPNPSTVMWPSMEAARAVHGHDGRTQFAPIKNRH